MNWIIRNILVGKLFSRFESEDLIMLISLLGMTCVLFDYTLTGIFGPSITILWLFGPDSSPLVPANYVLPLRAFIGIIDLLIAAGYTFYGPPFRRFLARESPAAWKFISRFVKHFDPTTWIGLLAQVRQRQKPFATDIKLPLSASFPSTLDDKKVANMLYKEWHGNETPKYSIIEDWHEKNPLTEGLVRDVNNNYVGFFDFFPVNVSFVEELKTGIINEFELRKHLLPDSGNGDSFLSA